MAQFVQSGHAHGQPSGRLPVVGPYPDAEPETGSILTAFVEHQAVLASHGFFLPGGIAVGYAYIDRNFVFGAPLLEAHALDVSGSPPRT